MHFTHGGSKSSSMTPTILCPGTDNDHIKIYQTRFFTRISFLFFSIHFYKGDRARKTVGHTKKVMLLKLALKSPHIHALLIPKSLNSIREFFYSVPVQATKLKEQSGTISQSSQAIDC